MTELRKGVAVALKVKRHTYAQPGSGLKSSTRQSWALRVVEKFGGRFVHFAAPFYGRELESDCVILSPDIQAAAVRLLNSTPGGIEVEGGEVSALRALVLAARCPDEVPAPYKPRYDRRGNLVPQSYRRAPERKADPHIKVREQWGRYGMEMREDEGTPPVLVECRWLDWTSDEPRDESDADEERAAA